MIRTLVKFQRGTVMARVPLLFRHLFSQLLKLRLETGVCHFTFLDLVLKLGDLLSRLLVRVNLVQGMLVWCGAPAAAIV